MRGVRNSYSVIARSRRRRSNLFLDCLPAGRQASLPKFTLSEVEGFARNDGKIMHTAQLGIKYEGRAKK